MEGWHGHENFMEAAGIEKWRDWGRGQEEMQEEGSFSNTLGEAGGTEEGCGWSRSGQCTRRSPRKGQGQTVHGEATVTGQREVRRALPLEMKARKEEQDRTEPDTSEPDR